MRGVAVDCEGRLAGDSIALDGREIGRGAGILARDINTDRPVYARTSETIGQDK